MLNNSKLLRGVFILLGIVITSLFYFPIIFKFIPVANTKQMLAACGAVLFFFNIAKNGLAKFDKDFLILSLMAVVVSLFGLAAVAYNSTNDYAYAYYLGSMWVWMAGAYSVCTWIRWTHGKCSVPLICNYLIVVCVFQCIMALWMDYNHDIRDIVDIYIEQGQDFLKQKHVRRIYGIGASLDVAGIRFSLVLIAISYMMMNLEKWTFKRFLPLYLVVFVTIAVIGNIVARTTTVGLLLAIIYLYFGSESFRFVIRSNQRKMFLWIIVIIVVSIPLIVYLYNTNYTFHKQFRFAFEGFFSMVEKGKWYTTSNETLSNMYVWPELTKTWIIGDGYFSSARNDPYFIGEIVGGFYMGTDVGYLRFIFYFGLPGLIAFSAYFIKAGMICAERFKQAKWMFFFMVVAHFVIWLKVSTDIFLCLALFLCIGKEENEEYYKEIEVEEE